MKLKEWFTDESKWTKGAYFRDQLDCTHEDIPDKIQCCCLSGAIRLCYEANEEEWQDIYEKVTQYINFDRDCLISIIAWNDSDYTTFEDVKKLVNELDI